MGRNSLFKDLTGQQCGKWIVVGLAGFSVTSKASMWLCRCDCGFERIVQISQLRANTPFKGCRDCANARKRTHGLSGTPTYHCWQKMIKRCYDPDNNRYRYYGARGITVCAEWLTFAGFLKTMGVKPKDKSLGRIDNDKGYSSENCRWETNIEQANNKSNSHLIEWNGRTLTVAQWAKEKGFSRGLLKDRIMRYGWTIERALTTSRREQCNSR